MHRFLLLMECETSSSSSTKWKEDTENLAAFLTWNKLRTLTCVHEINAKREREHLHVINIDNTITDTLTEIQSYDKYFAKKEFKYSFFSWEKQTRTSLIFYYKTFHYSTKYRYREVSLKFV